MALDSTGLHLGKQVLCFLCEKIAFSYISYTPEHGHQGEKLENYGSSIESVTPEMESLKRSFYLIKADQEENSQERVIFEKLQLQRSSELYHYGGYLEPQFGESVGDVLCLCPECTNSNPEEMLSVNRALRIKFFEKLNQRFSGLIANLYMNSLLVPNLKNKQKEDLEKTGITLATLEKMTTDLYTVGQEVAKWKLMPFELTFERVLSKS